MTVALSDTNLLASMLDTVPDFADFLATAKTTAQFYTRRKPLSATVNTLANALYQVDSYCLSSSTSFAFAWLGTVTATTFGAQGSCSTTRALSQ
jgi:Squalene epoxidase